MNPGEPMPNEVKIVLCNIIDTVTRHAEHCDCCATYIATGDGDLCDDGKRVMENELITAQHSFQHWADQNDGTTQR